MSEENKEAQVGATEEELAQLDALVEQFPELAEEKEIAGLSNIVKNTSTDNNESEEEEEEQEEEEEENEEESEESEEEEEEESEEEEEESEEEEEEESNSDIFGNNSGNKKSVEVGFEFGKDTKSYIKDKYSINDESKFFTSVEGWRKDSQELGDKQDELQELVEGIQGLPENLQASIGAYARGEDYREAFGISNRLDYNKNFSEQGKDAIVEHYFADKFKAITKEEDSDEITQEEADKRIEDLYDVAEGLYKRDKTGIENKRADMIRRQQDEVKAVKESVNSSVSSLKKTFPNFKSGDIQRIKQILVNGNLESLFLNKDGSYKESAALMLAFATKHEEILKRVESTSENKGRTNANKEIANRGKKKISANKAAANAQQKKAHDAIQHLEGQIDSTDPYS